MEELLFRFRWQILASLLGLVLLGAGVFWFTNFERGEDVEVVQEEDALGGQIVAEIAGEVEKPGVYELETGARIEDLLVAAGGITESADWVWVQKNLNRAAKLADGMKIYIPKVGESGGRSVGGSGNQVIGTSGNQGLVNVNTATQSELEALWGIGPVTAKKIIEGRPYSAVEELLTRKILKQNVYEANKDKLIIY